jgi:hypothetical protein
MVIVRDSRARSRGLLLSLLCRLYRELILLSTEEYRRGRWTDVSVNGIVTFHLRWFFCVKFQERDVEVADAHHTFL